MEPVALTSDQKVEAKFRATPCRLRAAFADPPARPLAQLPQSCPPPPQAETRCTRAVRVSRPGPKDTTRAMAPTRLLGFEAAPARRSTPRAAARGRSPPPQGRGRRGRQRGHLRAGSPDCRDAGAPGVAITASLERPMFCKARIKLPQRRPPRAERSETRSRPKVAHFCSERKASSTCLRQAPVQAHKRGCAGHGDGHCAVHPAATPPSSPRPPRLPRIGPMAPAAAWSFPIPGRCDRRGRHQRAAAIQVAQVSQLSPCRANFWQTNGQARPKLANFGQLWAAVGAKLATSDQLWATLGQIGPQIGQVGSCLAEVWRKFAQHDKEWSKSASIGRNWADLMLPAPLLFVTFLASPGVRPG